MSSRFFKKRNPSNAASYSTRWFWILALVGLVSRFSMLHLDTAETTDGVLCLSYFSHDFPATPRFVILPGYPCLLGMGQALGLPGELWGRVLSALAGILVLLPLWKLSCRWVSSHAAGWICLCALISPLLWKWSLQVMPDTLFLLAFTWALERLATAYLDKSEKAWIAGVLLGAFAACVRPEGFLLFPWILWLGLPFFKRGSWVLSFSLPAVWAVPFYFLKDKILLLFSAYREGLVSNGSAVFSWAPFLNFGDHLIAYLFQPFWVMTPLLYGMALLGWIRMAKWKGELGRVFRSVMLPIYGLLLLSRLFPTSYIDRHMLPFLPLVLLGAGVEWESVTKTGKSRKKHGFLWLPAVVLIWLFSLSLLVLWLQKDSLGDVRRAAEFLKTTPADAVIYSDEIPKTQYWSGRPIQFLDPQFKPRAGDYVVCHSLYMPYWNAMDRLLKSRLGAVVVYENQSQLVPLMTDFMEDPLLQNRAAAAAFRFQTQFFESRVYRIGKSGTGNQ